VSGVEDMSYASSRSIGFKLGVTSKKKKKNEKIYIYNCFCCSCRQLLVVPKILQRLIQIPTHQNQFNPAYLRQVIYNFGENMSYEGFVAGDLLSQHRTARL
jgi:hypothetical protein